MFVEESKNNREWEEFLQASPERTFFHSIKWKEVIEKSFSYPSIYLVIREANGTIVGICPGFVLMNWLRMKIYHSMPYSDYGGPVIAERCIEQVCLSLRCFLESYCSNRDIIYAKFLFMNDGIGRFFKSPLEWGVARRGIMEVNLEVKPSDFIWNRVFSKHRRYDIRLMERRGFQAQEAGSKNDLGEFYVLYHRNMKCIGVSPYPYEFLENMWEILYPEHLRIWLIGKDERSAGILCLKNEEKSYIFFVGLDRSSQDARKHELINYLFWEEIKKADEEGLKCVSLGSAPIDPENRYYLQKKSFGSSLRHQEIAWYPLRSIGRAMLRTKTKIIPILPNVLKRIATHAF